MPTLSAIIVQPTRQHNSHLHQIATGTAAAAWRCYLRKHCSRKKEDLLEPPVINNKASGSTAFKSHLLLWPGGEPVLDVRYPTPYLASVEVCIPGEVLTDWGVGVAQSTVKGGATHTDHYSNQTKQEEKQTGVPTANICMERPREGYRKLEQ